jgi:isocitrate dehydrogenase (NAD+)
VGGLGVVPGANLGTDIGVFEAVHGSAPDIADQNLANPTALLLSGLMMLDHIGEGPRAERVRAALASVLAEGTVRTRDLGGTATTTEFTDAICREIDR